MKTLVGILLLAALVFAIYANRPIRRDYPGPKEPLRAGETNPPLRLIGDTIPPEGTRIWFDTNCQPAFTILDASDSELITARMNSGLTTFTPELLRDKFMEAK